MNGKSKIILLILTMLLTVVLLLYMTFAWFDIVRETKPIIIHTGSLRLETSLYYAEDEEYEEITEAVISFDRVTPGEKYHFRLYVKNVGTIPGYLSVAINELLPTNELILKGFQVSYVDLVDPEKTIVISFEECEENKLILFQDVILTKQEFLTFDFTIEVTSSMTSQMRKESLTITNFLIGLDQLPQK